MALTRKSFYISIFTSNHFRFLDMQRERERERERREITPAPARAPIAHPSTGKSHPSIGGSSNRTSKHRRVAPQLWQDCRTPTLPKLSPPKTDPSKTDLVLDPKLIGPTVLAIVLDRWSISLSLDCQIWWIFFVGFCFLCVYLLRNDIIYLFGSWENVSNK